MLSLLKQNKFNLSLSLSLPFSGQAKLLQHLLADVSAALIVGWGGSCLASILVPGARERAFGDFACTVSAEAVEGALAPLSRQ